MKLVEPAMGDVTCDTDMNRREEKTAHEVAQAWSRATIDISDNGVNQLADETRGGKPLKSQSRGFSMRGYGFQMEKHQY